MLECYETHVAGTVAGASTLGKHDDALCEYFLGCATAGAGAAV
jgi:hypothetical protein